MRCAIFGTGPRATHVVLAGDRVPAGTVLVTPGLEVRWMIKSNLFPRQKAILRAL